MKFKKKMLAVGVLAVITMLIAPAAFASNTLSIDAATAPAADVAFAATLVGSSNMPTNFDDTPGTCTVGSASGYFKRGSSVSSTRPAIPPVDQKIGAITDFKLGTPANPCLCSDLNLPTIQEKDFSGEWGIYVTATPAKGATTVPVEIRGVSIKVYSAGAIPWAVDYVMKGNVPGTFNQATQRLVINTSGSYPLWIRAYNGAGTETESNSITCAGQIYTGDAADMIASFVVSTPGVGGIHW